MLLKRKRKEQLLQEQLQQQHKMLQQLLKPRIWEGLLVAMVQQQQY